MDPKRIISAARKVGVEYKKDRNNRYALLEPIVLTRVRCRLSGVDPFSLDGELIKVEPDDGGDTVTITVKPYSAESGVCDGCSFSPDLNGCVEAALFHDPWYMEMDDMAAATGIPVESLRRLGDDVFGALCREWGAPGPVARLYHAAVRWFGGLYHKAAPRLPILIVAAAALAIAGCSSSCAGIPDILDGPVPAPSYERSAP